MRTAIAVLVFVVLCQLSSCASTSQSTAQNTKQQSPPETTVRVDNRNLLDMTIYVLENSQRIRLGTVTSLSTSVFKIPNDLVPAITTLRFLADPIGGMEAPISEEITVAPGEQVTLTITN